MGIGIALVTIGNFVTVGAATGAVAGAIGGALVGAAIGGLTSAIMGGDIGKGILFGAIGGAVTGGLAGYGATAGTVSTAASSTPVTHPMGWEHVVSQGGEVVGSSGGATVGGVSSTSIGAAVGKIGADAIVQYGGDAVKGLFGSWQKGMEMEEMQKNQLEALEAETDAKLKLMREQASLNASAGGSSGAVDYSAIRKYEADLQAKTAGNQLQEQRRQYDVGHQERMQARADLQEKEGSRQALFKGYGQRGEGVIETELDKGAYEARQEQALVGTPGGQALTKDPTAITPVEEEPKALA